MDDITYSTKEKKLKWWPFTIFGAIIIFGLMFLFFGADSNLRSPLEPSSGCVVMQDRGDYGNSVNIVFLGTSYEDVNKFQDDSEKMMLSFLNTFPYSSYKERFNFFRIESFENYGCQYGDAVICNPSLSQAEATKCPGGDYVIVLSDQSNIKNFFQHLRSSSWINIASLNAADDPLVFVHEFAHLFGDFADEYEFGGDINWDAPNCDKEFLTCPKFSSISESECIVGCVNNKNSRSIDVGIMRDYWSSKRYGAFNEWFLENMILKNTKESGDGSKTSGNPKEKPEDVYIVSGSCINEKCEISEVQKSLGYITENRFSSSTIIINHGKFSVNVPQNNKIIKEFRDSGEIIYPDSYDFSVSIPIIENENLVLIKDGNIQDTYSFGARIVSTERTIDIPEVNIS